MRATNILACALAVTVLAACASSDDKGAGDTSSETSTASTADSEAAASGNYQQRLEDLYVGTYTEPKLTPVATEPGKNVWFISVGQNIEPTDVATKALEDASRQLGWDLTVFDGVFDSSKQLTGIQQAVAAGADGIVLWAIDCGAVKNGLVEAAEAGIPTVAIEGLDCDPAAFTHVVTYGDDNSDYLEWIKGWGAAQAAWTIAKTDGAAKVILVEQTDLSSTVAAAEGWREELAGCQECEIVTTVEFVGADFGPALQGKIEQALTKYPEANSLIPAYDAVMTSGGAAALAASGRLGEMVVAGGEGSSQGIAQIVDGTGMQSCVGLNSGQETFAGVDALLRIFAGQDPNEVTSGIGYQVCDQDNNLPPPGEIFQSPIDYRAAYNKAWGLG